MRDTIRAAVMVLAIALAGPVMADQGEDGRLAYKRHDYATAIRLWRPLADQGDAKAQLLLGSMYQKGEGVSQNFVVAVKWYRLSANQGDATAPVLLGERSGEEAPAALVGGSEESIDGTVHLSGRAVGVLPAGRALTRVEATPFVLG